MAGCENPEEVLKRWNGSEWVTVACVKRMVEERDTIGFKTFSPLTHAIARGKAFMMAGLEFKFLEED